MYLMGVHIFSLEVTTQDAVTPSFAISSALREPDQLGSEVYEELVGAEIYWTIDIPSNIPYTSFRRSNSFNPLMTNEFSHHYQLDESTFIFRGVRSGFYFLSHFSMKFLCKQHSPRWDATFCGVTSEAMLFAYVP